MKDDGSQIGHRAAQTMLDAFASVGTTSFDVTWTDRSGKKVLFRRNVSLSDVTRTMPAMLERALPKECNVIVRPRGQGVTFVQLDDLKAESLPRIAPAVFLILETSPANFQAWVAITGTADKDFARRLRKGTGADDTASGATRVAGSLNFKDKYAPVFPRVAINHSNPGCLAVADELQRLGLVSALEVEKTRHAPPAPSLSPINRKWPSYERALDGAPLNSEENGPDVSRADFVWCMTAISWGWSVEDTAARLMEESTKAQENGQRYADLTARNAAVAVARRQKPFDRARRADHG
jgi:hypothetical protein